MIELLGQPEIERYIAHLRAVPLSPSTIVKERDYLKICLKFINKTPKELNLEDIERWRYEMIEVRKYERETVFASLLILRKFLRFVENPVAEKIKMPVRLKRLPPEKEIWLLPEEQQAFIQKSREMGIRDYAMIRLFLDSGVRAGELIAIDLGDIDMEHKIIHIRHGKGDKSRYVPFTEDTKLALQEYLCARKEPKDGSQALFVSTRGTRLSYNQVDQRVKECAILCGIKKPITPHKLRHTFITNVIERTKDIPLAQKLAGHEDIKVTMRYHHSTHEQVIDKYRQFFDNPSAKEMLPKALPANEIQMALIAKFARGEIPFEVFSQLMGQYEIASKKQQVKAANHDFAYQ